MYTLLILVALTIIGVVTWRNREKIPSGPSVSVVTRKATGWLKQNRSNLLLTIAGIALATLMIFKLFIEDDTEDVDYTRAEAPIQTPSGVITLPARDTAIVFPLNTNWTKWFNIPPGGYAVEWTPIIQDIAYEVETQSGVFEFEPSENPSCKPIGLIKMIRFRRTVPDSTDLVFQIWKPGPNAERVACDT